MDRREQISAELARAPRGLSPGELAERLGISRQAVARHLKGMLASGVVAKRGRTRKTRYFAATWRDLVSKRLLRPFASEDRVYAESVAPLLQGLPTNVVDISRYVFTEMVNNAIDHADAASIDVALLEREDALRFVVADNGIGCFERIRRQFDLEGHDEALAHLSKGKQTTAPEAHSGEGIFFSSKVADRFTLESNNLCWQVDVLRGDVGVGTSDVAVGTRVTWVLSKETTRELGSVFDAFATEAFAFDRTQIHVRLFEHGEAFISRSEAKRLLAGLGEFKEIILDYAKVRIIGQGFADQIYRVYQAANPDKVLISINAAQPIARMIGRAGGL